METERQTSPGALEREQLFLLLYKKAFPAVAKFISKRGGDLDEAKDVFQEALVIYYEQVIVCRKEIHSSETAYLMGTAKHLWYQWCREKKDTLPLDHFERILEEERQDVKSDKLLQILEMTSNKCLTLLKAFYYDQLTITQLAEVFGYSSERSATVQKYKCLESVRNQVKEKQLQYEDFLA